MQAASDPAQDPAPFSALARSRSDVATLKKHTYLEMIQVALLTLNERGGSTRKEIWKCIEARFPHEANYRSYILALKKIVVKENAVIRGKNRTRFALEKEFKLRALKRLAKNLPLKSVLSSKATLDPVKKAMKAKKKKSVKKPKSSKKKTDSSKPRQNKKASTTNAAKGDQSKAKRGKVAGPKTTKDKIKQKAKENKKTVGSQKT